MGFDIDRAQKRATAVGGVIRLPVAALRRLPVAVRRRVFRSAAVAAGADPRALAQPHLDALVRLVAAASGRTSLPGAEALCTGRVISFRRRPA